MKKGFTLVESLVTICILGILSTLAISNFIDYRRKVYDMEAANFVNMVFTAAHAVNPEDVVSNYSNTLLGFSINKKADSTTWLDASLSGPVLGTTVDIAFPGMTFPGRGVVMSVSTTYSSLQKTYVTTAWAFHCKGTPYAGAKIRAFQRSNYDSFGSGIFYTTNNKPIYNCSN